VAPQARPRALQVASGARGHLAAGALCSLQFSLPGLKKLGPPAVCFLFRFRQLARSNNWASGSPLWWLAKMEAQRGRVCGPASLARLWRRAKRRQLPLAVARYKGALACDAKHAFARSNSAYVPPRAARLFNSQCAQSFRTRWLSRYLAGLADWLARPAAPLVHWQNGAKPSRLLAHLAPKDPISASRPHSDWARKIHRA